MVFIELGAIMINKGLDLAEGFFSAPRLHVESITYSEAVVEIGSSYNSDYTVQNPQKFECRVWIIKIRSRNRAFSILRNCVADAYIITAEGRTTSHAVGMPWKNLKDPPAVFAPYTSLSKPDREEYKRIFGYYYAEELRENYASSKIDVRKVVANDLYFMLTFKDSPFAYLLTTSGSEISHNRKDVFYEVLTVFPSHSRWVFNTSVIAILVKVIMLRLSR